MGVNIIGLNVRQHYQLCGFGTMEPLCLVVSGAYQWKTGNGEREKKERNKSECNLLYDKGEMFLKIVCFNNCIKARLVECIFFFFLSIILIYQ